MHSRYVLWMGAAALIGAGCLGEYKGVQHEVDVAKPPDTSSMVGDVVEWDTSQDQASADERTFTPLATTQQIVFLNRAGRTYTGGKNDSEKGTSSIIGGRAQSVTVPPAPFDDTEWAQIVSCVQKEYADYNVAITDQRPASGPYVEAAVGGRSSLLGLGSSVTGISPMRCGVIARSVAFVFAAHPALQRSTEEACITIAHEVGHSVGLEHSPITADPMTYLHFNGHKTFQNQDSECGTGFESQPCQCGSPQNTVQRLLTNLGPATGAPNPPPTNPPPTNPPPTNGLLSISSPADGAMLPGNSMLSVVVNADSSLSDVGLFWEFNRALLQCNNNHRSYSCTQSGSTFTWVLNVGTGQRKFHAEATDPNGNTVTSETRTIELNTSSTPMDPVISVATPSDGARVAAGSTLTVAATISDDTSIGAVTLDWTRPGTNGQPDQTVTFPMDKSAKGHYAVTLQVSPTAVAGARRIDVRTTSGGKTINSDPRTFQIYEALQAP